MSITRDDSALRPDALPEKKEEASAQEKLPNWIEEANTPHSYFLFDTLEEEKIAREQKLTHEMLNEIKENKQDKKTQYFAFGCQGELSQEQKEVAALMNEIIDDERGNPSFVLGCGDNVYKNGAQRPDDPAIRACFDEIYLKYPHLKDIPFFMGLGNHCHNYHRVAMGESGVKIAANQVWHTYLDSKDQFDKKNLIIYTNPILVLKD